MKHIQNRYVTAERRFLLSDVMLSKFELAIAGASDFCGAADFSPIEIQSQNRLLKRAFAQVKAEKPCSATDIEQRLIGIMHELVDRRIDWVAP